MTLAVTSLAFGGMSDAFGIAELTVTTNAVSIMIPDCIALPCLGIDTDEDPGLVVANLDSINFPGTCADIDIVVGVSKPQLPSAGEPHMDVGWLTTSTDPCVVELLWTDTDFNGLDVTCVGDVGGTAGGTFDGYSAFYDTNNVMGAQVNEIINTGPLGSGAFSGSDSGPITGVTGAPYSITMKVEFSHGSGVSISSGDAELECAVQVGGTLLPISSQSLFLAGIQSMTVWMIPAVVGLAGAGVYLVKFRANRD